MSASFAASRVASYASRPRDASRVAPVRALFALVWAAALVAVAGGDATSTSSDISTGAAALIASYPVIDVLASIITGRGMGAAGRGLRINAALSSVAIVAIVVAAFASDTGAALVAFGAWAAVSGAIQLAGAVRHYRSQDGQLPLIVSGVVSTFAGIWFIAASGKDNVHLTMVAGYMAFGALLFLLSFLISARRTRRAEPTGR
jgi:uncharacterized membrane protein HdeD (DUF308 family)